MFVALVLLDSRRDMRFGAPEPLPAAVLERRRKDPPPRPVGAFGAEFPQMVPAAPGSESVAKKG